ncbi:MAG: hypothetical protein C0404_11320 [Verrucomicrobia bacterium]|nr:hypothetical protein [Verrucomicrobiota bacterium]
MLFRTLIAALFCLAAVFPRQAALASQLDAKPIDAQLEDALKLLVSADDARDNNNKPQAITFYRIALEAYSHFAEKYPNVQAGIVKFRINYCASQLEALGAQEGPVPQGSTTNAPAKADGTPVNPEPAQVPKSAEAIAAAKNFLARGAADEARSLLLDALRVDPDNKTVRLLLAISQCQVGRYDDAGALLRSLIEEDASFAQAHAAMGTVMFAKGKNDEALDSFKKALELNPNMGDAYYDIAQIYLTRNPAEIEAAGMYYRKALSLGVQADEKLDALLKR